MTIQFESPIIRTDEELKKYLKEKYGEAEGTAFYNEYKEQNDGDSSGLSGQHS